MRKILDAVIDAIKATPEGTPEGSLYALLLTQGCSLNQFQAIIGALCKAGKIRKEGHLLFA
jgi:hypothetical protein